jgi:hypothetical protein
VLAAAVAFAPSFAFILLGGERFDRLRADRRARAFLDGAGPAAIGAILGSAIPLARPSTSRGSTASWRRRRCSCWPCAAASCSRCCSLPAPGSRSRSAVAHCPSDHLHTICMSGIALLYNALKPAIDPVCMDLIAIALALAVFAVLALLIEGIERV